MRPDPQLQANLQSDCLFAAQGSLIRAINSLFALVNSLFRLVGNYLPNRGNHSAIQDSKSRTSLNSIKFPVFFPVTRESGT